MEEVLDVVYLFVVTETTTDKRSETQEVFATKKECVSRAKKWMASWKKEDKSIEFSGSAKQGRVFAKSKNTTYSITITEINDAMVAEELSHFAIQDKYEKENEIDRKIDRDRMRRIRARKKAEREAD